MSQFLTHLSSNSAAAVASEIENQPHWLSRLRQAELFIFDRSKALDEHCQTRRALERQMNACDRQKRKLERIQHNWLQHTIARLGLSLVGMFRPTLTLGEQIEAIQDKLDTATRESQYLEPLIRDALMELRVAESAKARIVLEHPDVIEMSFEEIQQELAPIALRHTQARYLASILWARQNGLPDAAGQMALAVGPQQAPALLHSVSEQLSEMALNKLLQSEVVREQR